MLWRKSLLTYKNLIRLVVSLIILIPYQNLFADTLIISDENKKLNIVVAIYGLIYQQYKPLLDNNFCSLEPDFQITQYDRQLIELWLVCDAAKSQNYALEMSFVLVPNNVRGHLLVEHGVADMFSDSVWKREALNLNGYITEPIFRNKEFEKGLYVLSDSPLLDEIVDKKRVRKLRGLGIEYWINDWVELQKITSRIVKIEHQNSLYRILKFDRADFTLLEFSSNQTMALCQRDTCLMPINGLKVVFHDSRHMLFSKTSKMGKVLYETINAGIKALRTSGKIRTRLVESRQINTTAKTWQVINE